MFPMLDEEPDVTPKWRSQYINAEILHLTADKMTRGQVVCKKHDVNFNPIDRSSKNPILDTCLYEMEFPEGEMTKLVAYIIAESIYDQFDVDGKYLLLEASWTIERMIQLSV